MLTGIDLRAYDRHAFAGLGMWAETNAEGVHTLLHALDIELHTRQINDCCGTIENGQWVHV
jgi:hypothetical protein